MSYLVFARKYRPTSFDDVVGQEHVTSTLKNAIKANRLAHAYIFAGPRGIGKTSCARILAKSLNCEKGHTVTPCNACDSCKEIAESRSMDVIEIDGASNRGIDEIRTLRENVKFSPTGGRFKVYIIDEVHMLTPEAFNALLKTLEEPPEHVKFIFATTAPHKVLPTILSRCQRFDFRRISVLTIIEKLEEIARAEKLSVAKEVLLVIAKAASGSMRDAESILDQLSAFSKEKIDLAVVTSMLGMVEEEFIFEFTGCIIKKESVAAFKLVDKLINEGKDINQFILSVVEHFRNLMVAKVGGSSLEGLLDLPPELKEAILKQSENLSLREILRAIELLVSASEMARIVDSQRIPLEICVAELTFGPVSSTVSPGHASSAASPSVSSKPASSGVSPAPAPIKEISPKIKDDNPFSKPAAQLRENPSAERYQVAVAPEPAHPKDETAVQQGFDTFGGAHKTEKTGAALSINPEQASGSGPKRVEGIDLLQVNHVWDESLHKISKIKMYVATCLQDARPIKLKNNCLVIGFPKTENFNKEAMERKENRAVIEKTLKEMLASEIRVEFELTEEEKNPVVEPVVQTTLDAFRGKVVNKWHHGR